MVFTGGLSSDTVTALLAVSGWVGTSHTQAGFCHFCL